MITQQDLKVWKINAGFIFFESELFDANWRKINYNHECKDKYATPDGAWYCKHLKNARNKNKKLIEIKKTFVLQSPFVKDSYMLRDITESVNGLDNLND